MKKQYKKSIKKRIENALMKSSLLSIAITTIAIFFLMGLIIKPIGLFFTTTINSSIYDRYTMQENPMMDSEFIDKKSQFEDVPYEVIKSFDISNKNRAEADEITIDQEIMDDIFEKYITVEGDPQVNESITLEEKKSLLIASIESIEQMDRLLKLGDLLYFDWAQVTFILYDEFGNEVEEFKEPKEDISLTSMEGKHDIESFMYVFDSNGEEIGYIKTTLNESLIAFVMFPVIIVLILIAVVTFIIVKIVLTPSTFKLVKPIKGLNNQLRKISENEVIDSTVHIEMKKPPKEIYELIKYSNIIMARLNESQELLFAQNQELEAQRDLLEDANVELEAQKDELEAQNEELDTQNDELMQSQLELKKAQDRLVQSEKLASMGQLTAAIAHEINTPLGAVSSNTQMIEMMLQKLEKQINEEKYEDAVKTIKKLSKSNSITTDAAARVNEIIRNLRNFSRIDQAEFQKANIQEGIHSVLVLTSNLWKNKLTIEENYGSIPDISCYPSMLNQVFMNVIVNAIQATEKDGRIEIKTSLIDDFVRIEILDDGIGIPEPMLEQIFESGFTTKPKESGTGLGLSISKDIIKKHHGRIKAINNEEKGATFIIDLPLVQPQHDDSCDHD